MSRAERTQDPVKPGVEDPNADFLPSARPAKYAQDYEAHESSAPLVVEDDQINTEWYNPTDQDVVLELHVGTDPKNLVWLKAYRESTAAKRLEMKSGNRIMIVKAGQTRMVPAEFDLAIQRTHCLHPQCTAKKDLCKDLDHPRVVAGGLAPQLLCKRWHRVPSLAANLDIARAEKDEAMKQVAAAYAQRQMAEHDAINAKDLMERAQVAARESLEAKERAEAQAAADRKVRMQLEDQIRKLQEGATKR
jgi:hypothetical protein